MRKSTKLCVLFEEIRQKHAITSKYNYIKKIKHLQNEMNLITNFNGQFQRRT